LSGAARAGGLPVPRLRAGLRRGQQGLSLIGLLLVAAIIIVIAIVGMRVLPSTLEFFAIRGAVEKIAASGVTSAREVQVAFDRQAAVDDISAISGRDLIVERVDGGTALSFAYEKRVPLFGPVSLVIDYHGTSLGR
jgi:hypothetical protein